MRLAIGCRFDYTAASEVPATVLVEPHSALAATVVGSAWDTDVVERFQDIYGNVCVRVMLPPGPSSLAYEATVTVSPEPEPLPPRESPQSRVEDIPSHLLHWLLPSRLCESDLLADRAWALFGSTPPTAERVYSVVTWIHESLAYGVPSVPTTTAAATLDASSGMCRDFAHLGVTFCRALGIPARYVCGYMPDIGIPGPYPLMDFHAWFEVWLGGSWWTFDARFNVPRIGRVPIGRGRDAVDVAMVTTYGDATLERMSVRAEPVSTEQGAVAAGVGERDGH